MAISDKLLAEFQLSALTTNLRPDDEEIDCHTKPLHGVVYGSPCDEYGLNKPQHWWEAPGKVNENDRAKILWDFYIQTDKHVLANQPDIVVVDKENKRATVIDIAVPNDYNIASKEKEKKPEAIIKLAEKVPHYDLRMLEQLLNQVPGNKDTKVYVISISGKYRSGKSFLFNLFKIYLDYYSQFQTDKGWKVARDMPIRGWEWRCGQKSVTHGIWMYVYPKLINNKAIILLDCQGTADPMKSDPTLDNLILFLALQLGDVHILNVNQSFGCGDLSHLSVCALHADDNATGHIFQANIVVVRNWNADELPMQLDDMLEETDSPSAKDDLRGIKKAFRVFNVETLPFPGKKVNRSSETAGLQLGHVTEEFLEEASKFFNKLLFVMSSDANLTSSDLRQKFMFLSQRSVGKITTARQAYEESLIKTICEQLLKEFNESSVEQKKILEEEAKAGFFHTWPQIKKNFDLLLETVIAKYDHHPRVANCENQYIVADYRNHIKEMYKVIVTNMQFEYALRQAEEKMKEKELLVEKSERKWKETKDMAERATAEKNNLTSQLSALQKTLEVQKKVSADFAQHQKLQGELDRVKLQLEEAEVSAILADKAKNDAHGKLIEERVAKEKAEQRTEEIKKQLEEERAKCTIL
ncbi:guanylate-binding protein 4-like [Watersipora subatra]|uniref:guanylate-binding protein 4-like n=1 Tax=Watersipora subatra TaxID=2589382 RepID=UPI00355BB085